ncbi:MAG: hypothetical protein ACI8RD_012419, partial [Bacillariaceae sp.]
VSHTTTTTTTTTYLSEFKYHIMVLDTTPLRSSFSTYSGILLTPLFLLPCWSTLGIQERMAIN